MTIFLAPLPACSLRALLSLYQGAKVFKRDTENMKYGAGRWAGLNLSAFENERWIFSSATQSQNSGSLWKHFNCSI